MLKLLSIALILFLLAIVFFSFTNPDKLAVGWLMIPVLLIFSLFTILSYIILRLFYREQNQRKQLKSFAVLAGISASLFLLFQSTGGIVLADLLLMGMILIISYLYINKF